jgi:hypothetical protein
LFPYVICIDYRGLRTREGQQIMSNETTAPTVQTSDLAAPSIGYRLGQWLQDPMGSVVAASAAVIGSFGFVVAGMWAISAAIT